MTKSRIIKKAVVCLLLSIAAEPTFAAEKSFDVASLDKDSYRQIKNKPLAPQVTEAYEYYEIKGCEEKELRRQMTQNGSAWVDGKTYDSVTRWHVKWDYDYDRAPEACSVDSFKATVDITFRYPKWVHTDDVPQPLVDKWDGYMNSLVIHENGHRDMAVEAVAELSRAVAELSPASTCADIDRKVQALSRELMEKLKDDAKAYDATTLHGFAQGAVFP